MLWVGFPQALNPFSPAMPHLMNTTAGHTGRKQAALSRRRAAACAMLAADHFGKYAKESSNGFSMQKIAAPSQAGSGWGRGAMIQVSLQEIHCLHPASSLLAHIPQWCWSEKCSAAAQTD